MKTGAMGTQEYCAIAAMAENRVIGAGNQISWHLPEDFKWFKQTTMGHDLVMGRRTFESIGRPLPGRQTYVVSRGTFRHPGVIVVPSLEALPEGKEGAIRFICGGEAIYRLAMPLCSDLYLTRVKRVVEGDRYFPPFEESFELVGVLKDHPDFLIQHYRRIEAPLGSER